MLKKSLIAMLLVLFSASGVFAATYQVDPVHSEVSFTVTHLMMFKVKGTFDKYNAQLVADPATGTLSSVQATIQTASIDTREKKRDDHLRSADFFDVANHPEMTFVSRKITGNGKTITVNGDLTIRGVTKPVVLTGRYLGEVTDPWGKVRAGFEASGTINRQDFGLKWNKLLEAGGVMVGDDVQIGLDIQAIKKM